MDVINAIVNIMVKTYDILLYYEFIGIPLLHWSIAFIITNMAISIFGKEHTANEPYFESDFYNFWCTLYWIRGVCIACPCFGVSVD